MRQTCGDQAAILRELKEEGLIIVKWLGSAENTADLFTKNLGGPPFNSHTVTMCGHGEHYAYNWSDN
jgi:hypothetical protein